MRMTKNKKLKCYTYIRVSTEMQIDGYSLDAQTDRLRKYAEYQGMQIVHEYCDAGKSGKNITGRPEFLQMLQDVADIKDDVNYILVFKLSRFGRNAADVLNSLQHIQDFGVNLICVEDGIDSSKDSGKLTITVLSAVAEIERENILVQTMEGRKQKAREGKWNGGIAPYGYRLDKENGVLIVDPDEAEIVKVIYDLFAHSDMGADTIAKYLNEHGFVKNRSRDFELGYFSRGLVMKILDNPVYLGKIAYGKRVTEKIKGTRDQYHRVQTDDYLLSDGKHDSIIDEELWNAVRRKRSETGMRWVKTHSMGHEHILTGIIKCPICGAGMSGMVQRRTNKKTGEYKDDFYYRCKHTKMLETGKYCDFKLVLKQDKIDSEVENIILDMVHDKRFQEFITKKLEEKIDTGNLQKEREGFKAQLKQVNRAKNKLSEQMDKLDVDDRYFNRKYQDMQRRLDVLYGKINDIDNSIAELSEKISGAYGEGISVKNLCNILTHFDKVYKKMSDLEKKHFMRDFISTIEIFPEYQANGRILKHIEFKFPVNYDGEKDSIMLSEGHTEETVVLMSRFKGK
jgi:site-specific DNA recombinase